MREDLTFQKSQGIWRFLVPERRARYSRFIREYETVRKAEGRAFASSATYQALPDGRSAASGWRLRARSFATLVERVVTPMEKPGAGPLRILDLGAGNCWLSNRLSKRGHFVAAIDLLTNDWDGLGAHVHYETEFTCIEAEYERLPLSDRQCELVIFNSSLHYSENYGHTLTEAKRVLANDGRIVIIDTPLYSREISGARMVAERERFFTTQYGFPSNSLDSENFLTTLRLKELSAQLSIAWIILEPELGFMARFNRALNGLRSRREPARLPLIVGK